MPSKSTLALKWPVYAPRGWGTPTNPRALQRPWWGLDTERDAETGEFVCGFAVGEDTHRFEKLQDLPAGTYWVWNLAYDIEGMLRDVGLDEGWAARADGSRFPFLDGKACYYHGKRFEYKDDQGRRVFLEASSFWGRCRLAAVGAKMGGVDASKMSLERYTTDPDYRAIVDEYCQQDARVVYENVTTLAAGLRGLGVEIGATPGATARRFLNRMGGYPPVLWRTHKAFLRSYCGGRFEVVKRGVFFDVGQYDIVSAYPWALSQCPWLTKTAYHRATRRISDDALYGSYLVKFHTDEYLGLAPGWHNGVRVYSRAEDATWITRPELLWLHENGYDFTIKTGVEIFDENATDLWRREIEGAFALKRDRKGEPESIGAKIVLNSMYGILIQLVRKAGEWVPMGEAVNPIDFAGMLALEEPPKRFEGGKFYAPVYAATLTALTRLKMMDAARSVGAESYIGGHTDSILTTKPLKLDLGKELGQWDLEKHAPRADVCKTGMYAIGNKIKMRGVTRDGTKEILWARAHERTIRTGIKSAADWDEVSLIRKKVVANNYEVENKRHWLRGFDMSVVNAEEWIDSEALHHVC